MDHTVAIEANKNGTSLRIDERYYVSFSAIPDYLQRELRKEQLVTIKQFFDIDDDPHGDVAKIFGRIKKD
jgi:hypothetical protein